MPDLQMARNGGTPFAQDQRTIFRLFPPQARAQGWLPV